MVEQFQVHDFEKLLEQIIMQNILHPIIFEIYLKKIK